MKHLRSLGLLSLLFVTCAAAADPKIETISSFAGNASDAVKVAIADAGYRVTTTDGKILAEIWPAKSAMAVKSDSATPIYPEFQSGAFYGVITFPNGGGDYRGQKIPAGTYTLRYQLLPSDGNHLGVAPSPDFFLLVPVDSDPNPSTKLEYRDLIRLSAKSAGSAHPAAFSLATPAAKPVGVKEDQGHLIAYFPIGTANGPVNIGMILSGASEEQ